MVIFRMFRPMAVTVEEGPEGKKMYYGRLTIKSPVLQHMICAAPPAKQNMTIAQLGRGKRKQLYQNGIAFI